MKNRISVWEQAENVISEFLENHPAEPVDLGALIRQLEAGSADMSREEAIIRFLWELGRQTREAAQYPEVT
ncbi:MAG: hypothetical protein JRI36_01270 [Deltaproteobacteria bacterium]|nr:hypothetical protein [Deltaproteobacteria bacterium]